MASSWLHTSRWKSVPLRSSGSARSSSRPAILSRTVSRVFLSAASSRLISAFGNRARSCSSAPASDSRRLTVHTPVSVAATSTLPSGLAPVVNLISIVLSPIDARQYVEAAASLPAVTTDSSSRASSEAFMTQISVNHELSRKLKMVTLSIAAWGGIAALFSLQRIYAVAAKGVVPMWDHLALEMSIVWGTWLMLTPLIFFIVRRLPLPSEHPGQVLMHVPIGIGFGLLHSLLVAAITPLFIWRPSFAPIRDMFAGRLASAIAFETLIYFLVVAVLYAFVYASESKQRQIAMTRAEAGLARAQLDAKDLEDKRRQLALQL